MKERMTAKEYREMISNNTVSLVSDLSNKQKMRSNEYKLSNSKKKIDLKGNKQSNKYRNRKIMFEGQSFDSQGELNRWCELMNLQLNGHITDLMRQVKFTILKAKTYHLSIHWIPDFTYKLNGIWCVEDFKSPITEKKPDFRIKVKLFKKMYPDYLVYISTKKGVKEWK